MAITNLRGNTQIKDASVTVAKLATENGATWTIAGDNLGVIDGLGTPSTANQAANKAYVDGLVDSGMKSPDGFATDVDGNYPSDYKGSGSVSEGDVFYITSVANGTHVGTISVNVGDLLVALVDTPLNVDANWVIMESNRDQATETVKGVMEIATQAETDAGLVDTDAVTPLKLASYISNLNINKTAGAGMTETTGEFDVVATDASIKVNADDLGVQVGNTNGNSLEITATGVELLSTINGDRTFSSNTFTVNAATSATLGAPADGALLTAQPTGVAALAIATTKYVDDAVSAVTEIYGELPIVSNGSANVTLANTPISNTERVYLNGLRMAKGSSQDYTISGTTITFSSPLLTDDIVLCDYKY